MLWKGAVVLDFIWKVLTWGSPSYQWDKGRKKTAIVQLVVGFIVPVSVVTAKNVQKALEHERKMELAQKPITYTVDLQELRTKLLQQKKSAGAYMEPRNSVV